MRRMALVMMAALAGHGLAASTTQPADDLLLVQRNIFSRTRSVRTPVSRPAWTPATTQVTTAAPRPESFLVLRGILEQDGRPVAYIENTSSGQVLRLAAGEAVAGGRLGAVSRDAIDYMAGGSSWRIEIGQTLDGGAAQATTTPTTGPAPAAGGDDIVERLKRRRLEEQKK